MSRSDDDLTGLYVIAIERKVLVVPGPAAAIGHVSHREDAARRVRFIGIGRVNRAGMVKNGTALWRPDRYERQGGDLRLLQQVVGFATAKLADIHERGNAGRV